MRWREQQRVSHRGFSLIEMVLSLSLVGLVLASLGSVLAFSMNATPKPDDPASRLNAAQLPLGIMTEEIGAATRFVSISPQKIVFEVADRTGDSVADTIAYSWDGAPGDPLLRQINSDTAVAVLDSVSDLAFDAATSTHTFDTIQADSGTTFEEELSADTAPLGNLVALLNSRKQPIRLGQGFAQQMRSNDVPGGALYWVPEYVRVQLERNSEPGAVRLEIRMFESGSPTGRALASTVVKASDLSSENWVEIRVPGTLRLESSSEIGVALICIQGDGSVATRVFEQVIFGSEPAMFRSSDGGDTWNTGATTRLSYRLRGEYFMETSRTTAAETTVDSVAFTVSIDDAVQTSIAAAIDLPAPVRLEP